METKEKTKTTETSESRCQLTGKEGSPIDLKVAAEWTRNHRHRHPGGVISQFFGQEILNQILEQPDCIGLRFYYANSKPLTGWQRFAKKIFKKSEGEVHLIISGVTPDGKDQLPASGKGIDGQALGAHVALAQATTGSTLGEQAIPCPGGTGCPQNVLTGS
ncbi:hypothetical protein ACPPVU_01815 [Mucilaginibacter sp. McL0603]|uniref:hypothetical protein n=1 Tax=Mucilaginibacter sp. McL0603 TaxID=3415670 RepID=UPI003CE7079C